MIGPGFAQEVYARAVGRFVMTLVLAFLLGAVSTWGIPKLWAWLKPFIHAVTA